MNTMEAIKNRRSVRRYAEGKIAPEVLHEVIEAGLLAPSGHSKYPYDLYVVQDPELLVKLSQSRAAAKMLEHAAAAVVVCGRPENSDVWVEDCALVMGYMHLAAYSLGLGSCWVQLRLRTRVDGSDTVQYVRDVLSLPDDVSPEAVLSLGLPGQELHPHSEERLRWDAVHEVER